MNQTGLLQNALLPVYSASVLEDIEQKTGRRESAAAFVFYKGKNLLYRFRCWMVYCKTEKKVRLWRVKGLGMREKKEINIFIGNEIRRVRERAGLTQEQFGELVSLGTKNVSDIERGVAGITVSTLKRICEKMSVSSDYILFGERNQNDVEYITERLTRLPPKQFEAVKAFLDHVFELYGRLDRQ